MSRPFIVVVLLTLSLLAFQVGTVYGASGCQLFSGYVDNVLHNKKEITFYLYKDAYSEPRKVICYSSCELRGVRFNPYVRTTFIIHGFLSNYHTDWIQEMIFNLFAWQKMNIIVVDWSENFNVNYYQTARRVSEVAHTIKRFLEAISIKLGRRLRDWPYLHFIGHSLGAHVAGEAALLLRNEVFVHRVTALDPAKPYFDGDGANMKLKKWSAQFVDVIHTNCGNIKEETFGLCEALGHMDFYVNGGDGQPKCRTFASKPRFLTPKCVSELIFGVDLLALQENFFWRTLHGNDMICDHGMAPHYLSATINGRSLLIGKRTNDVSKSANRGCAFQNCIGYDCVPMGMHTERFALPQYHGVYYVNTECKY